MIKSLKSFFQSESAGGIVLISVAILALIVANNSFTAEYYEHFIHIPVTAQFGAVGFDLSFVHFVNDALMAIFFLAVALEIKHEMLHGHLSSFKKASFPFFGALGGMIAPAIIYYSFNSSHAQLATGWAIPTATDIAFAVGVLSLLGNRVPVPLKVFLLALAVIDDLGAIVVIALFYSSDLNFLWILSAAVVGLIMFALNRARVGVLTPYLLLFVVLWYCFLKSGIHSTISGVLAGFLIPNKQIGTRNLSTDLEHYFKPWITWFIMPLFAFTNSGVPLGGIGDSLAENMTLLTGIFFGLVLGKPIGIFTFTYLATLFKLTTRPAGTNWSLIFFIGFVCGIGFTMSIFITNLSFPGETEVDRMYTAVARLSILISSFFAAIIGLATMSLQLLRKEKINN